MCRWKCVLDAQHVITITTTIIIIIISDSFSTSYHINGLLPPSPRNLYTNNYSQIVPQHSSYLTYIRRVNDSLCLASLSS